MNKVDQLKLAVWIIPVVFGAGGFVSMMSASSSGLSKDVEEAQSDIEEHEALDSHPVTGAKLEILVTEQRAIRSDMKTQSANLAAICQATGASCR